MTAEPDKLPDSEIKARLSDLPDWDYIDNTLYRELQFKDFKEAMGFIIRAALEAETMNHHPTFTSSWNKVNLQLETHRVSGVSELDFLLAEKLNDILQ